MEWKTFIPSAFMVLVLLVLICLGFDGILLYLVVYTLGNMTGIEVTYELSKRKLESQK